MSTQTLTSSPAAAGSYRYQNSGSVTFSNLLKSEWLKLTSLRSSWWLATFTVLAMVGLAVVMAFSVDFLVADSDSGGVPLHGIGAMVVTLGTAVAQLIVVALGALMITGEYATGQIHSTMMVAPRRVGVLAAKAAVVGGFVFATTMVGIALSYGATYPILSGSNAVLDPAVGQTWRILLGAGLYLALISMLALGVGALLRSSAGAISVVVVVLLVLPMVLSIFANWVDWAGEIVHYLPGAAGERIMAYSEPGAEHEVFFVESPLSPWQGLGLLGGYVAATLGAGMLLLKKRDV